MITLLVSTFIFQTREYIKYVKIFFKCNIAYKVILLFVLWCKSFMDLFFKIIISQLKISYCFNTRQGPLKKRKEKEKVINKITSFSDYLPLNT